MNGRTRVNRVAAQQLMSTTGAHLHKMMLVAVALVVALWAVDTTALGLSHDAKPKPGSGAGPKPGKGGGGGGNGSGVVTAPEFDTRSAGAAVALLVGGVLVLSERRRRDSTLTS